MKGPLFSVVIPWHGNLDHLVRSLTSVNAQSFDDFEIVVVANGPGVAKLADAVTLPEARNCQFVSIEQGDASRARNAGADAAKGEFVAFLDVDDRFLEHKLEAIAEAITTHDADLVWSRGYRVRTGTERAIYPPRALCARRRHRRILFLTRCEFLRQCDCGAAQLCHASALRGRFKNL